MEKFNIYIRIVGHDHSIGIPVYQYEDVSDVLLRFYGDSIRSDPLRYLGSLKITFEGKPVALWKNIDFLRDRVSKRNPIVIEEPTMRPPPPKKWNEVEWSPLEQPIVNFLNGLFELKK